MQWACYLVLHCVLLSVIPDARFFVSISQSVILMVKVSVASSQ